MRLGGHSLGKLSNLDSRKDRKARFVLDAAGEVFILHHLSDDLIPLHPQVIACGLVETGADLELNLRLEVADR